MLLYSNKCVPLHYPMTNDMPRRVRKRSGTGIYHVMLRGIFYAYCLMSNHVHLLIRERAETISEVVKKLGIAYAYYFNRKYGRNGHLFLYASYEKNIRLADSCTNMNEQMPCFLQRNAFTLKPRRVPS